MRDLFSGGVSSDWADSGGDAAALPAATFTGGDGDGGRPTAEEGGGFGSARGRRRRPEDRVSPHLVLGEQGCMSNGLGRPISHTFGDWRGGGTRYH